MTPDEKLKCLDRSNADYDTYTMSVLTYYFCYLRWEAASTTALRVNDGEAKWQLVDRLLLKLARLSALGISFKANPMRLVEGLLHSDVPSGVWHSTLQKMPDGISGPTAVGVGCALEFARVLKLGQTRDLATYLAGVSLEQQDLDLIIQACIYILTHQAPGFIPAGIPELFRPAVFRDDFWSRNPNWWDQPRDLIILGEIVRALSGIKDQTEWWSA